MLSPLLGAILGWFVGSVLRVRRRHVEGAMIAAGVECPGREARRMYQALGVSLVEFLAMGLFGGRALAGVTVDEESIPAWRAAVGAGRGVVVAASHTGNWDLAACAIAREVDLTVVTKHLHVGWIDCLWQRTRAARGVHLLDAPGAMHRAREALARGGAVAMMIDQVPPSLRQSVEVDFLGRPAYADRAPAALAASADAPLVVAAARRLADGTHRLHVLGVFLPPPRPGPAWVAAATIAATRALDAFVRRHPTEWLWLHRRWKSPRPAGDAGRAAGAMIPPPCKTLSSSPAVPSRAA